ncbi:putative membrane protein [Caenispirillum salinarum AK4]|uniref:Putative membrane protein n=1 Tax=Caenispirillum salinarum AK4 TaxID=1238182 RepID=K9H1W8_9PROT|nr:DUF3429 domain-containing protein [Caenispirillum salinarum]EKV31552.1 putative membrane protein [Caenispirillum salinarum AK4]
MSTATQSSVSDPDARDPRADERRLERMAWWLAIAGLIPFVIGTIGVWMFRHPFDSMALEAQMSYGAVILSFLGAVHWGLVLRMPYGVPRALLIWGVTPSLVGWAALAFGPPLQHGVLMLGFLAAFIADRRAVLSGLAPAWYARLRLMLTTAVLLLVAAAGLRYIVYPLVDAFSMVPASAKGIAV